MDYFAASATFAMTQRASGGKARAIAPMMWVSAAMGATARLRSTARKDVAGHALGGDTPIVGVLASVSLPRWVLNSTTLFGWAARDAVTERVGGTSLLGRSVDGGRRECGHA